MADAKISALTEKTTIADGDTFVIVDNQVVPATTKKITALNVLPKRGWLSYSNASQIKTAANTTPVTMTFATDRSSFPNSFFTKTLDTTFRADYAGFAEMLYSVYAYPDANDRGWEIQVFKNGSALPYSLRAGIGKGDPLQGNNVAWGGMVSVSNGDLFTVKVRSRTGNIITVPIDNASFSIRRI